MYRLVGSIVLIAVMATLFLLKNPQETTSAVNATEPAVASESTDVFKNINTGQ